jgi:sarcosine oxidase subunit gamma
LVIRRSDDLPFAHIAARKGAEAEVMMRLGVTPGLRATLAGERTIIGIAPRQWLAVGPAPGLAEAFASLADVTDLTGARTVFDVSGPGARRGLSRLLPIDLHPSAFGPGAAAQTIAAYIGVLVWREGDVPAFRLSCYRSFARALESALHPEAVHG